jgi:hypothetical protein
VSFLDIWIFIGRPVLLDTLGVSIGSDGILHKVLAYNVFLTWEGRSMGEKLFLLNFQRSTRLCNPAIRMDLRQLRRDNISKLRNTKTRPGAAVDSLRKTGGPQINTIIDSHFNNSERTRNTSYDRNEYHDQRRALEEAFDEDFNDPCFDMVVGRIREITSK